MPNKFYIRKFRRFYGYRFKSDEEKKLEECLSINEKKLFDTYESRKNNLFYILNNIEVTQDFILEQVGNFDELNEIEETKRLKKIRDIINKREERNQKTNLRDLEEEYPKLDIWTVLAENQKVPEVIIEKYFDRFDDGDLIGHLLINGNQLPMTIVRKYVATLDWSLISNFCCLDEDFYLEFYSKISKFCGYKEIVSRFKNPKLTNKNLILLLKLNEGYEGEFE